MREFRIGDRVCIGHRLDEGIIINIIDNAYPTYDPEYYYTKQYFVKWDGQKVSNGDMYYFKDEVKFVGWYKDFLDKIEDRLG